jgi:hypothetical protein
MNKLLSASASGVALLLCTASHGQAGAVKKAEVICNVDVGAGDGRKGYVVFSAKTLKSPFRVFKLDDEQRSHLLAVIGVKAGKRYEMLPDEKGAPVAETLRVATAPGSVKFMIERGGRNLTLTVAEDKVTSVIVNYELLDQVCDLDICRIETEVRDQVPESERKPETPDKGTKG